MKFQSLFLFLLLAGPAFAQDAQIRSRLILIGDAGEINPQQTSLITKAKELIIPGKTTTLYLGDNIYPDGMALPGHPKEKVTREILSSQFLPLRQAGSPVYFIPGNHDWDNMGKDGLAKIRAQWSFIADQQDSLLKVLPANGCPGPVEIPVSENLVIIAYDSEYWLFPHKKSTADIDCECDSKTVFLQQLDELLYENRYKTIIVASHHPMRTYGPHGGYFSVKQHLFPLTEGWKNLYIPLPVVGSLYPLLRSTVFQSPEDKPHPEYTDLITEVTSVFKPFPNTIYVSGHDHGLQLIQDKNITQVVSGAGSRASHIHKGKHLLYKGEQKGFVILDQLEDRNIKMTYYVCDKEEIKESYTYTKPYKDINIIVDSLHNMTAGRDSVTVRVNPKYDEANTLQRFFLGENYRKEWAAETKLPVLRMSELHGGLKPTKRGGGMQSISLRLEDAQGKEWALRSVNKRTESLIPEELHHTFVQNVLDDANSAQHPYSALMIPPLAKAIDVPVANPVIGVVAPDTALGAYNLLFANEVALLEEREPLGNSDNSIKMMQKLQNDNDNKFKAKTFLRARILDVLINDWDRHEDQWRWYDVNKGRKDKDRDYVSVPRDRDQALRVTQGFITSNIYQPFIMPTMQGFGPKIPRIQYSMIKSRFLNAHPQAQLSYEEWMKEAHKFSDQLTDEVLAESISRLPQSSIDIRGKAILHDLKSRRDAMPAAMDKYYRFVNNIVDVHLSDKNEKVRIEDAPDKALSIKITKINKEGEETKLLMDKIFSPEMTREVRVYLGKGADSVFVNTSNTDIKLRIIGSYDPKTYAIQHSKKTIRLYDNSASSHFSGNIDRLHVKSTEDSANVDFVPVNLYNTWLPLLTAGYNADDGVFLGAGFKYTHQRGFRKTPFSNTQEFGIGGAIRTGAYRIKYRGQWKEVFGKADLVVEANAKAPDNSQNFFGMGNNSEFHEDTYGSRYYRARFNLFDINSHLLWNPSSTVTYSIGPSFQAYHMNPEENKDRFILTSNALHSYDSLTVSKDKTFIGLAAHFMKDNRNNHLNPTEGGYFSASISGYTGLNKYSRSYAQLTAEMGVYKSFLQRAIVLANRTGAGSNVGKPAFYQSLFLGGQGNLRGYRQYRFAGDQYFYNNLEARIRVHHINSYIAPGEIGVLGLYDIGKVWSENTEDSSLHQGLGGGAYYILAKMLALQFVMAHSTEGWYPYFSMGFRF